MKENWKDTLIVVLLVVIIVLLAILCFIVFSKKEEKIIQGTVIGSGDGYVILNQGDMDYILDVDEEYSVGTVLEIRDYQVNSEEMPESITEGNVIVLEDANDTLVEDFPVDSDFGFSEDSVTTDSTISSTTFDSNLMDEVVVPTEEADSDLVVLQYLEEVEQNGTLDPLKSGFVTVVDFLFYGGDIRGVTLQDITTKTKLTVLKYAILFDDKIDSYFPDYKEKISQTTKRVYTSVREKVISLYLNTTIQVCKKNEDLCISAKRDFQSMKESFGITWDLIKRLVSSGKQSLTDWYEIFSGK